MAKVCGNGGSNISDELMHMDSGTQGDCEENIMELGEEYLSLNQQIEDLQSTNDLYQGRIDSLTQEVQDLNDKVDKLRDQLKEKGRSEKLLQEKVQRLQEEVKELKQKLSEYEHDRDKLYLSQVAVEFERAICLHVIPEVFSKNVTIKSANIDSLLNMLNSGDEEYIPLDPATHDIKAILSKARPKWEKLCEDLKLPEKWKTITGKEIDFSRRSVPRIFRAMALLKRERNPVAHPNPVSVQEAKRKVGTTSIRNAFGHWEFELIEEFISGLQNNIETSHIKTDQKRLRLE